MMMRLPTILSALAAAAGLLVGAEASAESMDLRSALATVPASAASGDTIVAQMLDLSAARRLVAADVKDRPIPRRFSISGRPLEALASSGGADWEQLVGLPLSRIAGFVSYGAAPDAATVWVMEDEAAAEAVFDGLAARGFSKTPDGVMINGEPETVDFEKAQPDNPWLGANGTPSAVSRDGRLLAQANRPDMVTAPALATATLNLTSVPPVDTLLAGIGQALGQDTAVIQAIVTTDAIGVGSGSLDISKPLQDAIGEKQQQISADRASGLPPYSLALIADIEDPGSKRRGMAVAFAYADCATAEIGASRFAARWKTIPTGRTDFTFAEMVPSDLETRTVQAAGGCAAVIVAMFAAPADGNLENILFRWGVNSILNRAFTPATIAR